MMTSQHTLRILLLVYSVAVALPQERKRGGVNHYEEDFGPSSEVPGNSGEKVPVKFGRTIYHSAWSTEDTESSDENNQEPSDTNTKPFSSALRIALNFVNKLKGGGSDNPVIKRNNKKNAPKSEITNENEDAYWPLFKKWLRRNKILKNDDSLSSYLLEHNSRFYDYNHKNYQKKPRKKYFKNFKSSADENQSLEEKGNRKRNSKSRKNNKYKLSQIPKINNHGNFADKDQNSHELSRLYKAKEYHTFSDENCDSSKSLDKKKDKKSNDFIETNKHNKRIEEKKTVLAHLNLTSTEITTTFSSESSRKRNNPHDVLKMRHNSKSVEKISPETQTVSLDLLVSQKQQDTISFPPVKNKTNLKSITSKKFKAVSGESVINQAPDNMQNMQVVKSTQSSKVQNSFQNPLILSESQNKRNLKKNSENSQKTKKVAHMVSPISPTADESLMEKTSSSFFATKSVPQDTKSLSKEKNAVKESSKDLEDPRNASALTIAKNKFLPKTSRKEILKENQNDSQRIESVPHVTIPLSVYSPKSAVIRTSAENDEGSQVNGKLSPTPIESSLHAQTVDKKKNSDNLPVSEDFSQAFIKLNRNDSQSIKNIPLVTKPTSLPKVNSKDSKIKDKTVQPEIFVSSTSQLTTFEKVTSNDLPKVKSVANSASGSQHEKMPVGDSSLKLQNIKTPKRNSNSQIIEKVLRPAVLQEKSNGSHTLESSKDFPPKKIPVSVSSTKPQIIRTVKGKSGVDPATNSSSQTVDKNITKEISSDLPVIKSVSQTIKTPKNSPSDPSSKTHSFKILKKNSENSQLTKKVLKPAPLVNSSFLQTTDEVIKASNDFPVDPNNLPVSQEKLPLTNSPLQLLKENRLKEHSNTSFIHDSKITEPLRTSEHQPLIENIPKENVKNPKINERASSSVFASPQSNKKQILEENLKPMHILRKPDETSLKKVVNQKGIESENTSTKNELEPNHLFTEHEDSSRSNEDYPAHKLTFFSTKQRDRDFDVKSSYFEDLEMDSYSEMDSDEIGQESDENINSTSLSDSGNVEKSTVLSMDSSKYKKELKFQLTNEKSYTSSSVEELSDKEVEDQTSEEGEQQEKFDTFLQYIYKHSNSSYFQSLRQNAPNL